MSRINFIINLRYKECNTRLFIYFTPIKILAFGENIKWFEIEAKSPEYLKNRRATQLKFHAGNPCCTDSTNRIQPYSLYKQFLPNFLQTHKILSSNSSCCFLSEFNFIP